MWKKLIDTIGATAPTLATMLGTPAAGFVVSGLCKILGFSESVNEDEIVNAIIIAHPEIQQKILELNTQATIRLQELEIDDRKSARERETEALGAGSKEYIMSALAGFLTVGFFATLWSILLLPIQAQVKDVADIMLGTLGTAWVSVISYYFGGSRLQNSSIVKYKLNK